MLISSSVRRVLLFVRMRFAAELTRSAYRASRVRGHVREEAVVRGVRVLLLEHSEDVSQVRVHEVEGGVVGFKLELQEDAPATAGSSSGEEMNLTLLLI